VRTQKTSASSSSLHPVSGVNYIEKYDTLVFSLQDGSFHVIYSVSSGPTLEPPIDALLTAESLSAMSRAVFSRSEEKPVRKTDMGAVNGMVPYDDTHTFTWVYEYVARVLVAHDLFLSHL
jgi:general transcription factor 3C polypeptide 4